MQISKKFCFIVLMCILISFSTFLPSSLATATGGGQFSTILPTDPQFYFVNPNGIAVDKDGNMYVADTSNHRIQKLASDGTFQKTWGSLGTSDGQFQYPAGIAVDATGNVYVADSSNDRIQKFASDGTFQKTWGSSGTSDGQFKRPVGIAVDATGNVYVADSTNHRIQKFASDGTFQKTWGSSGTSDGQFDQPVGIAVDATGNVYVADKNNHRIQKFASDGTFQKTWGSLGMSDSQFRDPFGIVIDATGNVYVADSSNHRIQKFASDGTFQKTLGSSDTSDGQFKRPAGIAVDATGNMYVADSYNHRIQKFASDGTFQKAWGGLGASDGQFHYPHGIVVDATGNVYVADSNNDRIQKFTSDGTFQKTWGSSGNGDGQFLNPYAIAIDATGNVYVADTSNHRIQKFASDGTFQKTWGSPGTSDGQFQYPYGIAVDATGNVYVTDLNNNRVQKFASDGTFQKTWGSPGLSDGQFIQPSGIAIDATGNVYIADRGTHRIQKFTPDGTFQKTWGSPGPSDGQFRNPFGVAVDAKGDVYVADSLNHRIQKLLAKQPLTNNVELSGLTVNSGTLSPSFSTTEDTFTLNVDNAISSLTVTATTMDSLAKVEILGMTSAVGTLTHSVGLNVGSNVIPILVTAQDGVTTKTYTITVTRAGSSDTTLKSLTVSEGALSPAFASHIDAYTVSVDRTVSSLHITASPTDDHANVTINGKATTSDTIMLTIGEPTSIPIVVTAQDGGQKTYTVSVQPISILVTSVTLNQSTISLTAGGSSTTLIATVNPASASNKNVIWSSDNPTVASVDANGVVTPKSEGTATITVMTVDGSKIATSLVKVQKKASDGGGYIPTPTPTPAPLPLPPSNQISIVRVLENGEVKYRATPTLENVKAIISQIADQNERAVKVVFPSETATVEANLNAPRSMLEYMANQRTDLFIRTALSTILVPHTSLNGFSEDLFFRIVPVKSEAREAIQENAQQNQQVKDFVTNRMTITLLGNPVTIETNMQNRPMTITMPIPADATDEQKAALFVYIEHSDGTTEVKRGRIVEFEPGVKGFAFDAQHFSTFTLMYPSEEIVAPYIQGYPDGTFKPNASITRAQMATMLARHLTNGDIPTAEATFKDTGKNQSKDAIEFVKQAGLFNGTTQTTFDPQRTITRAQMASLVARWVDTVCAQEDSKTYCQKASQGTTFTDMPANHWAAQSIEKVSALGIMSGNSATTFNPNGALTRAQAVKVLNQIFERKALDHVTTSSFHDVPASHWAFGEIEAAATEINMEK